MKKKCRIGERNDSRRETKASYFREVLSIFKALFLLTAECSVTSTPRTWCYSVHLTRSAINPRRFQYSHHLGGSDPACRAHSTPPAPWGRAGGWEQEAGGGVWLLAASADRSGRDGAVCFPPWAHWGHKGISAWDEGGENTSMEAASGCSFQPLSLTS